MVREVVLHDILGAKLCGRLWHEGKPDKVLALHGWLDNAASFDFLAPLLGDREIFALDIIGHGRSMHKPDPHAYHFVDTIPFVFAVANALGWEQFSLLGHSMGAGIGAIAAGTFPERIVDLVMLDGFGPMASKDDEVPEKLAMATKQMTSVRWSMPQYADTKSMTDRLAASVARLPVPAADALVERGHRQMAPHETKHPDDIGYTWSADPKLRRTSPWRFSEGQVLAFIRRITCPTLVVWADDGIKFPQDVVKAREAACKTLQRQVIAGGHHLHMEFPDRVAEVVNTFWTR